MTTVYKKNNEDELALWNKIQFANSSINTTEIKGKDYAEVNQRVKAFRFVYPRGTIKTNTQITGQEDSRLCLVEARVYDDLGNLLADGIAEEKEGSTFINKTSFIENAQTSAVGRALGFAGFGIDTSIASKEEVENAVNNQEASATEKQIDLIKRLATSKEAWLVNYLKRENINSINDMTVNQASALIEVLKNA